MSVTAPLATSLPGCGEPPESIALEGDRSHTAAWLREVARTFGHTRLPMAIVAEPGAGSLPLALAIHNEGGIGPYTVLHCSDLGLESLPPERSPLGSSGTVVLEEIAELKSPCQGALARLIANGSVRARLLATNARELEDEARQGRLRRELVMQFGQLCVRIPALRHRREDIPLMAERLAEHYASLYEKPKPSLGPALLRVLQELPWPGNLPELDAMVRMIVLLNDERVSLAAVRSAASADLGYDLRTPLKQAARAASRAVERQVIEEALAFHGGNRKLAARQLEISYKALLYKLKQLGLSQPSHREAV
jgi:two-component system response regulator AtoC